MPRPNDCVRLLLLALSLAVAGTAQAKAKERTNAATPKPGKAIEVVFVGNSYTHFHDLPAMVRALGAAQVPPRKVETVMLAPGGFTLQGHWEAKGGDGARAVLGNRKPDFVVLQEQSRRPLDDPAAMQTFAAKWAKLVQERGAVPVWYSTWARQAEPDNQGKLDEQYSKAQQANGGLLAPVGSAWQRALQEKDAPVLHDADGSHPSPAGSYLAACVLFATMCGDDVTKFPDKLVVKGDDGKERVLVELSPEIGKRLRAAAAAAALSRTGPRR
jgi:hypothetical protein